MNYIKYIFFLLFCSYNANALVVIVDGEPDGGEHTPLLEFLSVSTGGSGGEDRLTENLTNVFISTGGSGGEDRLIELFDSLLVSTGGSGGEDRFTDSFNGIVNLENGTSLSDFITTIVLTDPTSTVLITAYDLIEPLYASNAVVGLFGEYTQYHVEAHSVKEPSSVVLIVAGLILLSTIQFRKRKAR